MSIWQWLRDNWRAFVLAAFGAVLGSLAVNVWFFPGGDCPPCPPMQAKRGTPTAPYDAPVKVPTSKIALPTVDYHPYPLPLPGVVALAATPINPVFVIRSEAFKGLVYSSLLAKGVIPLSLATLETLPAYKVGDVMGIGFAEATFDVCTTADGCASCVRFPQGVVCYNAQKSNYSFHPPRGWSYGSILSGEITLAPSPTFGAPPSTPVR